MHFVKMEGCGNDYIYLDGEKEAISNPQALARKISDRHFGVGADGMILICPSDMADCRMEMYNADGSRGSMCGNGVRCVARYLYDYKQIKKAGDRCRDRQRDTHGACPERFGKRKGFYGETCDSGSVPHHFAGGAEVGNDARFHGKSSCRDFHAAGGRKL